MTKMLLGTDRGEGSDLLALRSTTPESYNLIVSANLNLQFSVSKPVSLYL